MALKVMTTKCEAKEAALYWYRTARFLRWAARMGGTGAEDAALEALESARRYARLYREPKWETA